jgi:glycosyltransferase involved in cell wall biosynthesis
MLISVVIPLFNKEHYIERCLQSVLRQDYSNFEVIVIDDASIDNSYDKVDKLRDNRIVLKKNEINFGVSVTRNHGISIARSNFIAFMDADDEWLPNHLSNLSKLIENYPDASLWVSGYKKNASNSTIKDSDHTRCIYLDEYLDDRLANIPIAWTSAVLLNRLLFSNSDIFMPGLSHGEDQAVWLEMCMIGYIAKNNTVTAIYHKSQNSLSSKIVDFETDDALICLIERVIIERKFSKSIELKLLELKFRYALTHALTALIHQRRDVAKRFLALCQKTKIFHRKRIKIKILQLVAFFFPGFVSRFLKER